MNLATTLRPTQQPRARVSGPLPACHGLTPRQMQVYWTLRHTGPSKQRPTAKEAARMARERA